MDLPSFHPNDTDAVKTDDKVAAHLRTVAETILVITCGLFPLYFLPLPYLSVVIGKIFIFVAGLALALLFYTFSVLREGRLSFRLPWPVLGIVSVTIVSFVAAILSGDLRDSMLGNSLDINTAAFVLLMALTLMITGLLAGSKQSIVRLYTLLILSSLVISLWQVIRLVLGSNTLSFGLFTSDTSSLLGTWNGLAIFFGLIVLLSLVTIQQLPLTKTASAIIFTVSGLSLVILAVIGFSLVWQVLAAVSLLMLVYVGSTYVLPQVNRRYSPSKLALGLVIVVALTSCLFAFVGAPLNNWVSSKTNISFLEVRPSLIATIDLTKSALKDQPFFGVGPNHFIDVWRLHKNPVINQTIFWNTDFESGYNYVATSIVGTGLIGAFAWLLFFASLLWYGGRFLFKANGSDRFWYFIGLSALVSTVYLWGMSWLYVPSASILLLSALTTGLFLIAYCRLLPGRTLTISIERNRKYGIVLVLIMVLVVTSSAAGLYVIGNQIRGLYVFNQTIATLQPGDDVTKLENGIVSAFNIYHNDIFISQLAYYQWLQMNTLLTLDKPTTEQQKKFSDATSNGISAAELAISLDPTEPRNHQILAQIYSILAQVGVEGARDKALSEYDLTKQYNPQNPVPYMQEAQLYIFTKETALARSAAEDAVRIRPTYTEAIYFLTQLDISEGDTEAALKRTTSLVQLEPQNPTRRYQLGLLLAALNRPDEAITALEQAVSLNPQYANARYFLALGYAEKDRTDDAIEQLAIVRNLNPDNTAVDTLIAKLKSGESITSLSPETVEERTPESGVVTANDLDSDLVTSDNTPTDAKTDTATE